MISGEEGGRALLTVRGSAIEPASPIGKVVSEGTVFQPLRLISAKDGKLVVRIIPWTYLRVESIDGPVARCAIVSGLNDPLSKRFIRGLFFRKLESPGAARELYFLIAARATPRCRRRL